MSDLAEETCQLLWDCKLLLSIRFRCRIPQHVALAAACEEQGRAPSSGTKWAANTFRDRAFVAAGFLSHLYGVCLGALVDCCLLILSICEHLAAAAAGKKLGIMLTLRKQNMDMLAWSPGKSREEKWT